MATNTNQFHGDDEEKNETDLAKVTLSDDDLPEEEAVDEVEDADPLLAAKMQEENEDLADFLNTDEEDPADWS